MRKMFQLLFGCVHEHCSFPITVRDRSGRTNDHGLTYRVCLDCGTQRKYDWQRMRYIKFERGEERRLRTPTYGNGVIL